MILHETLIQLTYCLETKQEEMTELWQNSRLVSYNQIDLFCQSDPATVITIYNPSNICAHHVTPYASAKTGEYPKKNLEWYSPISKPYVP